MDRDEMAVRICCALIGVADPERVDPKPLADCAVLTADALIKRLCQPQPQ